MVSKILGVIAGNGSLPELLYKDAKNKSYKMFFVFIDIEPSFFLEKDDYITIKIGQVGKALKFLKSKQVSKVTFAGGVKKPNFSNIRVDFAGARLLALILKNKLLGDNNLLSTIASYMEQKSLEVIAVNEIIKNIHFPKGFINKIKLNEKNLLKDIEFAKSVISNLSQFDIGQSIIVQHSRILGIEAAEGTDQLIKRCKEFTEDNNKYPSFLFKSAKEKQDKRMDLPTIGVSTIENLAMNKIDGLVIDSQNVLAIDKEEIIKKAEEKGVFIFGI